jgi:hypothetical protein
MSRAKQVLMALSLLIVVIGGGWLWRLHSVRAAQNKEFDSVVEPMIRDLTSSNWSPNVVYKYASPRLKQRMDKNPVLMMANVMPRWTGNMTQYDGVQGVYFNAAPGVNSVTAKVKFDYGNVLTYPPCGYSYVTLLLYKNGDKWSLDGFAIDSPAYQGLYMYSAEHIRLPPMEEILLDLRWFTGNDSLRPGCLFH